MEEPMDLGTFLDHWAKGDPARGDIAVTVVRLSEACCRIGNLVSLGSIAGSSGPKPGGRAASTGRRRSTSARTT